MKNIIINKNKYILLGVAAGIIWFAVIFMLSFMFILSKNHVILPWDISFKNCEIIDEGGIRISLYNKEVILKNQKENLWKSDDGVKVSDVLWEDIDGDEKKELILLCWKRGKFGQHKPFWIEEDEKIWSQHIFIYEYDKEKELVRPKWMASDIGFVVEKIEYKDGGLILIDKVNHEKSFWLWNGWGLERVKDLEE